MSLPLKIYFAPFQGVTGYVYREVYARFFPFIDKFFTPFFTDIPEGKLLARKKPDLSFQQHYGAEVVPQILSNDAGQIIRFSRYCAGRGFQEVNWNLGCPFPRVARKKRGAGLLPHPDTVGQILRKVTGAIPTRLSVKCRLGYEKPDEIFQLLDLFAFHGISELIVHTRTGRQMYKGETDPDTFERLLETSNLPVVYNGDIFRVEQYKHLRERFPGPNCWMLGRGVLVDPFLPGDICRQQIVNEEERKKQVHQFVDDLYYAYRKEKQDRPHAIGVMKELWEYLSFSFDNPTRVFNRVKKTRNFDEYEDAVSWVFHEFKWLGASAGQFHSNAI